MWVRRDLIFSVVLFIVATARAACADPLDVPRGDLIAALKALQQRTQIQIIYRAADLERLQTRGVKGDLPASVALERLIEGTGLVMRRDPSGAIALLAGRAAPAPAPSAAPSASPLTLAAVAVETVTVTAQRRLENLQEVPITISNLAGGQMQASGVRATPDLGILTPGLNYTVATGYAAPYLRGIGSNNVGPGTESPVATYIDGVYIATPTAAVFALNSILQADVLRGPQGTLFGRNATAGVIQVTTLDPAAERSGEASVGYGDYGSFSANLYLTGPLGDGVSTNLSALYQAQEQGFGRNLTTGLPINRTSTLAMRSKLKWEISPATTAVVSVDASRLRTSEGISWRPLAGAKTILGDVFPGGRQDIYSNIQPLVRDDQGGVSLKVEHDLGWARLLNISAYRRERLHQTIDGDYGLPVPMLQYDARTDNVQASEELQLLSPPAASWKWILGAYGFYSSGRYDPALLTGASIAPRSQIRLESRQQAGSGALFGQMTREVARNTHLTLGLRYTVEQRRIDITETGLLAGSAMSLGGDRASKVFAAPTWRVALDHTFADGVMGYVSLDRGFKSGQFDTTAIPAIVVKPETLDTAELGLKSTMLDRRLRLNAALFYNIYGNMQVPAYYGHGAGSPAQFEILRNAARAQSYGLDASIAFFATSDLRVSAGLEILHSVYQAFPDAAVSTPAPGGGNLVAAGDVDGNHTILAPALTLFCAVDWRLPGPFSDLDANLTYAYNSGWYADPDNRLRQPSFNQVNAKLTWRLPERVSISIWGRNLTDETYAEWLSDAPSTTDVFTASPPRTYGFEIAKAW